MQQARSEVFEPAALSYMAQPTDHFAGRALVRSGRGSPGGKRTFQTELTTLNQIPDSAINQLQKAKGYHFMKPPTTADPNLVSKVAPSDRYNMQGNADGTSMPEQ